MPGGHRHAEADGARVEEGGLRGRRGVDREGGRVTAEPPPELRDPLPPADPQRLPPPPAERPRQGILRRMGGALVAAGLLLLKWAGVVFSVIGKGSFLFSFAISIGAWALFAPL